jgi:hypothetical protein
MLRAAERKTFDTKVVGETPFLDAIIESDLAAKPNRNILHLRSSRQAAFACSYVYGILLAMCSLFSRWAAGC